MGCGGRRAAPGPRARPRRAPSPGEREVGSGRPQGRSPGCSLEGGGGRAPQALTRRHTGAVQRGGPLTGRRRSRRAARVSAAALRPFSRRGRRFARPLLAQPDPGGPSVGSGAGGRKGAAEPAAGSFGLGSALSLAGDAVPDPDADGGAPGHVRGSAELGLPGKKLLLAPPSATSPLRLHSAGRGGAPSPRAPPPRLPGLPVLTGPLTLCNPRRVPCRAGGERWLEKIPTPQ